MLEALAILVGIVITVCMTVKIVEYRADSKRKKKHAFRMACHVILETRNMAEVLHFLKRVGILVESPFDSQMHDIVLNPEKWEPLAAASLIGTYLHGFHGLPGETYPYQQVIRELLRKDPEHIFYFIKGASGRHPEVKKCFEAALALVLKEDRKTTIFDFENEILQSFR